MTEPTEVSARPSPIRSRFAISRLTNLTKVLMATANMERRKTRSARGANTTNLYCRPECYEKTYTASVF